MAETPISPTMDPSGFAPRYLSLVEMLAADHDLLLVYLESDPEEFAGHLTWAASQATVGEVQRSAAPVDERSRLEAALRSLIRPRPSAWDAELRQVLSAWGPQVVITLGHMAPWTTPDGAVTASHPTVSFIEEDLLALPELRPGRRGRLLFRAETLARRRRDAPPAVVAVISPHERDWAERQYPRSQVAFIPHHLDESYWGAAVEPAAEGRPGDVILVGHLGSDRNAQGLLDVARALLARADLPAALRLVTASNSPPHRMLAGLPPELVHHLGPVPDPRPWYRSARLTLVPSFVVTGAKTGILQGWVAGCPVVTTGPAARTSGATPGVDVLAGETPEEVAAALISVWGDEERRGRLAAAGRSHFAAAHGIEAVRTSLDDAMDVAVGTGVRTRSLARDLWALARRSAAVPRRSQGHGRSRTRHWAAAGYPPK